MLKGNQTLLFRVKGEDANDIIKLRNNPSISKYLSGEKELSLEDQINWIINNNTISNDYYWKICNTNNVFCGTISLYNNKDGKAEFGRYICIHPIQAIEAEMLLIRFAFQVCNLEEIYCRTVMENTKVWKQHYSFGFQDLREEILPSKNFILKVQHLTHKAFSQFDYSKIDKLIDRL